MASAKVKVASHFSYKELTCPCGCRKRRVTDRLLLSLEALRSLVGAPLVLSSGYRCKKYNEKLGGAAGSRHLKGLAADVICKDSLLRFNLVTLGPLCGFNGIGVYPTHVHLDLREKDEACLWQGGMG